MLGIYASSKINFYNLTIKTMIKKCEFCKRDYNSHGTTWKFCSKECYRKSKELNLTWKKIWNLVIIGRDTKKQHLLCKCVCWKIISRSSHTLHTSWNNQSCWCMRKWWLHISWTQFYHKYQSILHRCNQKTYKCYDNYWWKWIKCEWRNFKEFYDDMYESYKEHVKRYGERDTTIDRIDNSKNYCKYNCRWATIKEQANNKTNNVLLSYKWEQHNIAEWADKLWLTFSTLYQRLRKWIPLSFIIRHPEIRGVNEYKKIEDCNAELKKYL